MLATARDAQHIQQQMIALLLPHRIHHTVHELTRVDLARNWIMQKPHQQQDQQQWA